MRRACIDIGSNTTRLLVADCDGADLVVCAQERAFTLIGRSLDQSRAIPEAKLREVRDAVHRQYMLARAHGAVQVRCVATAAVRRAANGAELARMVEAACPDLELELLSAEQEARFAFLGAARMLDLDAGAGLAVLDAGGGSCEMVVGDPPAQVHWWDSVGIGSSDVMQRWLSADPPEWDALGEAARHARRLFAALQPPPAVRLIAVGGSASSVRTIAGPLTDLAGIDRLLAAVSGLTAAQIAARYGVELERARLLPAGLVLLRAVCELFSLPLEFGSGGLREGVLLDAEAHQ